MVIASLCRSKALPYRAPSLHIGKAAILHCQNNLHIGTIGMIGRVITGSVSK